jgi:hypothetical protein
MRARIWIFTVLVALALAINLARVSLSIAQTGEDTMRARVAAASTALRGQIDLLDARLSPRAVAMMPDLIEAVRESSGRPDERALRAAGAVLSPEPDLFAVVNAQGAILSRRSRPVQVLEDPARLPLSQTASGAVAPPTFATFDNGVYRMASARVPGATAAAVVGMLVDDRFAAQLKSQVDADVTLVQGGRILASSLPPGDERAQLTKWVAAPGPGYGVLQIRLPFVGTNLSGKLPQGATRYAVRGALLPLDSGVHAALTVPASPYLAWLGRYQAFYAAGLGLFVLFGFLWGLLARRAAPVVQQVMAPPPRPEPEDGVVSPPRRAPRRPSPLDDIPAEPAVATMPRPSARGSVESLDPETAPREEPALSLGEETTAPPAETADSAVWGVPAEPEAAAQSSAAVPDWEMPAAPATNGAPAAGRGDFRFSELDPAMAPAPESDAVANDRPLEPEQTTQPFHEPPPAEPVTAAPMESWRGSDEESAPPPAPEQIPEQPDPSVTLQDFSMPGGDADDPDAAHWRETYDRFVELKVQLGEPSNPVISFEKFAAKLKKNRADLVAKHNCKGVRFSVYEKDGKAAIKASAIR